ncbi:hypothetical protein CGK74_11990 [Thauera propionica]|uniref:Abasic site processing protein n=1 Tax=Thauera propionica TaxID=2019431 RepID=A0A235EXC5_9RHOO|nr:SOS response-associated peptidase family protein [Thauera propionica]OYD53660.1 hypothetical protein CGK74_11990 [Thauera propionica]
MYDASLKIERHSGPTREWVICVVTPGFAGLWERWTPADGGESIDTFTVITTDANAIMRPLHDRMPVILAPSDYVTWLTKGTDPGLLTRLIAPCPEGLLQVYPVSKALGSVANEGPDLIRPLAV